LRCLLDTHAFIWWIDDDKRLSARARATVEDPDNEILVSVASVWEIATKAGLGQIEFPPDLSVAIPGEIDAAGFAILPINLSHALYVAKLPLLHRDPFDRMLIAQTITEKLLLITADSAMTPYEVPLLW
jgi:PIN domain nuclease of toxin-antitoxin system